MCVSLFFCFFLQWKSASDIVYLQKPSRAVCMNVRSSPLKRSSLSSLADVPTSMKVLAGSSSGSALGGQGSFVDEVVSGFKDLDAALLKALDLCAVLPTTSSRLSHTAGFLPAGLLFDEAAARDELTMESSSIEILRNSITHARMNLSMIKKLQDIRCKPFEDEALNFIRELNQKGAAANVAASGAAAGDHTIVDDFLSTEAMS
jgi:hypothetical protein